MTEEKCNKCKYKDRPKHIFPCDKCNLNEKDIPITCDDCRHYRCKKGIRPCKEFKWW